MYHICRYRWPAIVMPTLEFNLYVESKNCKKRFPNAVLALYANVEHQKQLSFPDTRGIGWNGFIETDTIVLCTQLKARHY